MGRKIQSCLLIMFAWLPYVTIDLSSFCSRQQLSFAQRVQDQRGCCTPLASLSLCHLIAKGTKGKPSEVPRAKNSNRDTEVAGDAGVPVAVDAAGGPALPAVPQGHGGLASEPLPLDLCQSQR